MVSFDSAHVQDRRCGERQGFCEHGYSSKSRRVMLTLLRTGQFNVYPIGCPRLSAEHVIPLYQTWYSQTAVNVRGIKSATVCTVAMRQRFRSAKKWQGEERSQILVAIRANFIVRPTLRAMRLLIAKIWL